MINRLKLAHLPTPVEGLPRLSALLGGPRLFIKRDDLTGLGPGGNKTRKLEYLVADALARGRDTLVSTGAVQSNHCRQVAAAAAKMGLGCVLVLAGEPPAVRQGNLLLDSLSGARIIFTDPSQRDSCLQQAVDELSAQGQKPYLIPYGGSNALGAQGYAQAMWELQDQRCQPNWIVFATSSGGTQAGLVLGAIETGFPGKVLGMSVEKPAQEFCPAVANLVNEAAALKGLDLSITAEDILVNSNYCAAGYGMLQPAEVEAIQLFARQEGILLDPVYTGRAAAGLVDLIRRGFFGPDETVLFWHTGGTPALFAEPYNTLLNQ